MKKITYFPSTNDKSICACIANASYYSNIIESDTWSSRSTIYLKSIIPSYCRIISWIISDNSFSCYIEFCRTSIICSNYCITSGKGYTTSDISPFWRCCIIGSNPSTESSCIVCIWEKIRHIWSDTKIKIFCSTTRIKDNRCSITWVRKWKK